jgi:transcriptional regulator of acetoin/glycerol metabolism
MSPTGLTAATQRVSRPAGSAPPAPPLSPDELRVWQVLRDAEGSITEASARLGVHRTTLWRWMKRRGLRRADYRA